MDYSLKPLAKSCSVTGLPLQPGSLCYSVLLERKGRYERVDFSPEGWTGVPAEAIGVWRTVVPVSATTAHPLQDLNELFDTFVQLTEHANDYQKKMRYVLALWLVRKKRLQLEETRETPNGSVMFLVGTQGEGQFEIPEEQLSEFEIAQLQAEIQALSSTSKQQAA
jgi:hypothetical protein